MEILITTHETQKKIAIIGAGWYGCHLALSLKKAGYDVVLYEKNHDIFSQISGKFGIRLHAGPHYPRSEKTRESCRRGAEAFKAQYPDLIIPHEYSIYGLGIEDADGQPSRTNQKDFERICEEADPQHYQKIDPKAYGYEGLMGAYKIEEPSIAVGNRLCSKFKEYLHAAGIEIRCNFEVNKLDLIGSKIIVGNNSSSESFDKVINTTGYQVFNKKDKEENFPFEMEAIYQPCLALVYKDNKPGMSPFSFIVMDGWFPCLMPYIENNEENKPSSRKYILTHGKWTIMGSYKDANKAKDILSNIDNSFVENKIKPFSENEMQRFWPEFKARFTYIGWEVEVLAKLKTQREFRSAITYEKDSIIHVIPGKVSNIFDVEKEVSALLRRKNIFQKNGYYYAAKGVLNEAFSELREKPAIGEPNTCNLMTYDQLKLQSNVTDNYSFVLNCFENILQWSLLHAAILANAIKEFVAAITAAINVVGKRFNMFCLNKEPSVNFAGEPYKFKFLFKNQKLNKLKKIYVLNNVSCDMDSFLSAIILSVARNLDEKIFIPHSTNPNYPDELLFEINMNAERIYLPLMNCKKGELKTRLDVNYLMREFNINEDDLYYINEDQVVNDLNNSTAHLILVDHNTLHPTQASFSDQVIEIIDHHDDTNIKNNSYKNLKRKILKFPLGSCTTLIILDYVLCDKYINKIITKILDPLVLVSGILLDTENFKKELHINRWVNLDYYVYERILIDHYNQEFEKISNVVSVFYEKLVNSKYDESGNLSLGVENLMNKDKKCFKWGKVLCEWSSLQIPLKSITKMFGWNSVLDHFQKSKSSNENISFYFTLSSYVKSELKILTIYDYESIIDTNDFIEYLTLEFGEKMKNVKKKKNYDDKIIKVYLDKTYSRKLLEPLINKYFEKFKFINNNK